MTKIPTGWVPDFPDFRDYQVTNDEVKEENKTKKIKSVADMMLDVGVIKEKPPAKSATKTATKKTVKIGEKATVPPPVNPDITKLLNFNQKLPAKLDEIRKFCSRIDNQGDLGSCTAHAGAAMVEYLENKAAAPVDLQTAAKDWYETIYEPFLAIIKRGRLIQHFQAGDF